MGFLSFLFAGPAPTGEAPRKPLRRFYKTYSDIPTNYTVIDVETSGLDACTCEILELAALKVRDNQETARYQTYIRPTGAISKQASAVNGLTWRKLCDKPLFEDIQQSFFDFIGDDVLVGHNIGFDIKFIQTRSGIVLPNKCFDTLEWSRLAFPSLSNYKLETLRSTFSLGGIAHSAMGDCIATHQLLHRIAQSDAREKYHADECIVNRPVVVDKGYEQWAAGEEARRAGDFDRALTLYQSAEAEGYNCPALYTSYAVLYRKLKDYEKEIAVTEKAMQKLEPSEIIWFVERKSRARHLLAVQQSREAELQRKAQERLEKAERRRQEAERKAAEPKPSNKKPVVQLTDNQEIVREFESISAAAKECGISAKGIRDAISGRQKHAGGYCWRYSNQTEVQEEHESIQGNSL